MAKLLLRTSQRTSVGKIRFEFGNGKLKIGKPYLLSSRRNVVLHLKFSALKAFSIAWENREICLFMRSFSCLILNMSHSMEHINFDLFGVAKEGKTLHAQNKQISVDT